MSLITSSTIHSSPSATDRSLFNSRIHYPITREVLEQKESDPTSRALYPLQPIFIGQNQVWQGKEADSCASSPRIGFKTWGLHRLLKARPHYGRSALDALKLARYYQRIKAAKEVWILVIEPAQHGNSLYQHQTVWRTCDDQSISPVSAKIHYAVIIGDEDPTHDRVSDLSADFSASIPKKDYLNLSFPNQSVKIRKMEVEELDLWLNPEVKD